MNRMFNAIGLTAVVLLVSGCGGSGPAGTVQGKVTKDGQGVPAQVTFKGETASVSGISDASGDYTLMNGDSEQIPIGRYQISVTEISKPADTQGADYAAMMEGGGAPAPEAASVIPKKYQSFGSSGLEFTVEEGANTFDIPLE